MSPSSLPLWIVGGSCAVAIVLIAAAGLSLLGSVNAFKKRQRSVMAHAAAMQSRDVRGDVERIKADAEAAGPLLTRARDALDRLNAALAQLRRFPR